MEPQDSTGIEILAAYLKRIRKLKTAWNKSQTITTLSPLQHNLILQCLNKSPVSMLLTLSSLCHIAVWMRLSSALTVLSYMFKKQISHLVFIQPSLHLPVVLVNRPFEEKNKTLICSVCWFAQCKFFQGWFYATNMKLQNMNLEIAESTLELTPFIWSCSK